MPIWCARRDLEGSGDLRVALFFLEVAFSVQKAASKLLNNAFYANLCCQIKKLPWSDPELVIFVVGV